MKISLKAGGKHSRTCLERIVHYAIYDHVSPLLTEWQHGFIKGRSCETTQLILTHHQWATALDKGRQVDVAFLDRTNIPVTFSYQKSVVKATYSGEKQ